MCWSCGCAITNPSRATDVHGDQRTITTSTLQDAADQAGTDIPGVIENLVKTLGVLEFTAAANVTKGEPAEYAACQVVKTAEEQRYSLGLAYPAMRLDRTVAADGHIDFVSERALEKTAWEWMTKQRQIGLFHSASPDADGHATVVESYIWRGPEWTVGETVIKAGDWLLGTVWDEHGWQLVKQGLVNGWSPEGGAKRARPSASRLAELRS